MYQLDEKDVFALGAKISYVGHVVDGMDREIRIPPVIRMLFLKFL